MTRILNSKSSGFFFWLKVWKLEKKDYLCPVKIKDKLFDILVRINGRVNQVGLWVAVLKTVGGNTRVSSSLTSSTG